MIRWLLIPGATVVGLLAAPGVLWKAAVLIVGVAAYAIDITLWPGLPCWKCKGTGKRFRPGGKAYGPCRRCKGGEKQFVRFGRRVYAGTNGRRRNP